MRCRTARDQFLRSRDGLLDETARVKLQRHLADCPRCAAWCGETEECLEILSELEEIKAPENFEWNVKRRIAMEKSRAFRSEAAPWMDWSAWGRKFIVGAAAAMVLFLAGAWLVEGMVGNGRQAARISAPSVAEKATVADPTGEMRFTETGYPAGIQYVSEDPLGGTMIHENPSNLPFRMQSDQRIDYLLRENELLRRQIEELRRQNLYMKKVIYGRSSRETGSQGQ